MNLCFPKPASSTVLVAAISLFRLVDVHCQPPGQMSFAGASSLQSLTQAWAEAWGNDDLTVKSDAQGSAFGIARACGTLQSDSATDIAGMSRLPFPSEAGSVNNDFNYKCERSARSLMGVSGRERRRLPFTHSIRFDTTLTSCRFQPNLWED